MREVEPRNEDARIERQTFAEQAEEILVKEQADLIIMARELLRDPYFPLHAAKQLGAAIDWPVQYLRAKL